MIFAKDELVYLDNKEPAMWTNANDMSKKLGKKDVLSYKLVRVHPKNVTFEQIGIFSTVCIDTNFFAHRENKLFYISPVNDDNDRANQIAATTIRTATNKCSAQEDEFDTDKVD